VRCSECAYLIDVADGNRPQRDVEAEDVLRHKLEEHAIWIELLLATAPEKTIKRRREDTRDAVLASDDRPIFSVVAKLVDALQRAIPNVSRPGAKDRSPVPRA
jgi:hypothetical protein